MSAFKALTRAQWRGFWREKQNWFWMLLFPLMFLFIFGGIMGQDGNNQNPYKLGQVGQVQLLDAMPAEAKTAFGELFTITKSTDEQAAIEQVREGDLDAVITQKGDKLTLYYSQTDQVKAATVQGIFNSFTSTANEVLSGVPPKFTLETKRVEDASLKPIQFIAPGLLGWAIAMGATFGAAMPFVEWRRTKLLRRIRLAPVSTESMVASRLFVSVAVAFVQTVVFIGIATALFGFQLTGAWYMAIPLVICATVTFMALGLIVGAVSKTAEGASGLANLVILPMAFLSGSFIPLDGAPSWIVTVSKFLPLGHVNEGLLNAMVRGQGAGTVVMPMVILLAFGAVFWLIAARLFRWDD